MTARLEQLPTLKIDANQPHKFQYNGQSVTGFEGDTIATALYADGIRVFSRSLKYHRPRGLYSLNGESANTYMEMNSIPNVCAETTILRENAALRAQNVVGTPERDWLGFMDKLSWAMPAGFYYHRFHKPAFLWKTALKFIRRAAGLGKISPDFRLGGRFDEQFVNTDVCIIGGGPAGLSAALAAGKQGLRVVLLESRPWLGGFYDYRIAASSSGIPYYQMASVLAEQVTEIPDVRVFRNTNMIGAYPNNRITAIQTGDRSTPFDERYLEIQARYLVVATGCRERPLIFVNNDKPGIMQVECARRLAYTYGVLPGKNAVFSVGDDLGLEAAVDLSDCGVNIRCVADARTSGQDPQLIGDLERRQIEFRPGWIVAEAAGKKHVKSARLVSLDSPEQKQFECDLLVAAMGLTPVNNAFSLMGSSLEYDNDTGFFVPQNLPHNTFAAGRLTGLKGEEEIELSGTLAGLQAAENCGADLKKEIREVYSRLSELPKPSRDDLPVMSPSKGEKRFVCFDEDVTVKHIEQALEAGFNQTELIKRYTSTGTGPGQGGIPGHNLPLLLAELTGNEPPMPKPTTTRPPLVPTYLAAYAGTNHDMAKRTPMHDVQVEDGGIFRRAGAWKRARYFSHDMECKEEIFNVRNNVGMLDASTLGKFRIHGPDSLNVLQRIYVSDMSRLKKGRIKYSAMCNDDGCIIDDGVVVKIDENDYYFTTSSGRAGVTIEWIRYHTRFDEWDFHLVNLTDAMSVINLAGPNSRKVLEKVTDVDLSNKAFPFSGYREFFIENIVPVRAMRLGFVGELSFELHVPASYSRSVWQRIKEAGREYDIGNFGVEAQNILRMEKCHVIIGSESEQRVTLTDIGLGWLWDRDKPEFRTVGVAALRHTEHQPDRLKLVAFEMKDVHQAPRDGSLVVDQEIMGYVCISRHSESLGKAIGLALVKQSLSEIGTNLQIFEDESKGRTLEATVVKIPFYDPDGVRMRM